MAVAVDATTPARWSGTPNAGVDLASAAFTAPADALLVMVVNWDSLTTDGSLVAASDSGGLVWTARVERVGTETTVGGYSGIFTARTTTSVSRTANVRQNSSVNSTRLSAMCYVLTGVDVSGTPVDTVGASNEGGATTQNVTTTSLTPGASGLLVVADTDWQASGAQTSSDLTVDSVQFTSQISAMSGYKACTSGVGVTGNIGGGASTPWQHKWCQIIVRQAAAAAGQVPWDVPHTPSHQAMVAT